MTTASSPNQPAGRGLLRPADSDRRASGIADTTATATTAILSALAEEQRGLIDLLESPVCTRRAGRDFWQGSLHGQPVVLALTKIGKVAAATTTTALIEQFAVARVVFTGVAGGLGDGVRIGDVVVATAFLQHDLDASPIFPRFEVPLYGRSRFECDARLTGLLTTAAASAVQSRSRFLPHAGAYPQACMHAGLIATGDAFISEAAESAALQTLLRSAGHEALAVEMEGAAMAQVCHDYGVPFAAVRTISDRADDSAHVDFPAFVGDVASRYARVIVEQFLVML